MSQHLLRLASQAINLINSGLAGTNTTSNLVQEEVEDAIIEARIQLIHKYAAANVLNTKDLYDTINCVKVDCKSIGQCCDNQDDGAAVYPHFEVPQILFSAGVDECIQWIGSPDKLTRFKWYNSPLFLYHKYKRYKSKQDKPYVYIDPSPNANGLLDCYILNCDFPLEKVSITAIFKNERQLDEFDCCGKDTSMTFNDIDKEVVEGVVAKFFQFYRQTIAPVLPITNNPGGGYPGVQNK